MLSINNRRNRIIAILFLHVFVLISIKGSLLTVRLPVKYFKSSLKPINRFQSPLLLRHTAQS